MKGGGERGGGGSQSVLHCALPFKSELFVGNRINAESISTFLQLLLLVAACWWKMNNTRKVMIRTLFESNFSYLTWAFCPYWRGGGGGE